MSTARTSPGTSDSVWRIALPARAIEIERVRTSAWRKLFGAAPPVRIGRYELVRRVGFGGMGTVYEARDPLLGRMVALKCLHPRRGSDRARLSRQRALAEAQALARLSSPNVVQIYDVGEYDQQIYFTMDLIDGTTLDAWLAAGPRTGRAILAKFMAAGRGLADAHAARIVHRDFKPANVLVSEKGHVWVADFGLAVLNEGGDEGRDRSGEIAGTRRFMAPEVRAGCPPDARADQYSWCRAAIDALEGAPRRGCAGVSRAVLPILARGLEWDPAARWGSMSELLAAIEWPSSTRRRRWAAAALAGAGLFVASSARPQAEPCALESSPAVWSSARRAEIRHGFEQRSPEYVHHTWPRIESHVDAFLADWEAARRSVCEAVALGRPSVDRSAREQACLQDQRVQLDALLDVFVSPDATTIEHAARAIAALPEVEDCVGSSPAALTEADATATRELRVQLERMRALIWAGRYAEARPLIDQARVAALTVADGRLVARVAHLRGVLLDRTGAYAEAADSLAEAAFSAERWHDDMVAAEALTELVFVVGVRQARVASGDNWARHARAAVDRLDGGRTRLTARLERSLGSLRLVAGDYEQARIHFERSRTWIDDAALHNNLGGALLEAGDHAGARREFEAARELWRDAFGPAHPDLALAWTNLGMVADAAGDYEVAREHHERALDMLERTLGPSNAPVARVSTNLGNTLYRLGEYEQAQLRFEAARTILGASPDPPPELGNVYVGLALIAMDQDRDTDAYGLLQRAQLVWETRLGSDHPGMGIVLGNLGDVALRLGRLDEAMLRLSRAIALKERTLGRQHASLAYPLTTLGKVLIEREDPAAAREHLQRALDLRASNPGVGPRLLAETRFALARAVWAVGDRTRAIELAHLARDGFAGPSTAADQDVAMVERWLAGR